jgi:hypothetical protein
VVHQRWHSSTVQCSALSREEKRFAWHALDFGTSSPNSHGCSKWIRPRTLQHSRPPGASTWTITGMGRSERDVSWAFSLGSLVSSPHALELARFRACASRHTHGWCVCVCSRMYLFLIVCTVDVDTSFSVDACTYLSLCHLLAERKQPCTVFIS